ncbi:hypothetical protein ACFSHP_11725 [Novosphingobium panipatense]
MAHEGNSEGMGPNTEAADIEVVEARPSRWHRVRVRAVKTLAFIVLGVTAFLVALVLGINTGPGRRFVADQIAALEFENGMRISVARIDGSLYGKMILRGLSVRDPRGEFLYSPKSTWTGARSPISKTTSTYAARQRSGWFCAARRTSAKRRPATLPVTRPRHRHR